DEIRELERSMYLAAPAGLWKVGVIIDADRMYEEPANAFLKTLEEPPPGCLLLLLTAHPEFLLPTIRSRCVEIALQGAGHYSVMDERERRVFAETLAMGVGGETLGAQCPSVEGSIRIVAGEPEGLHRGGQPGRHEGGIGRLQAGHRRRLAGGARKVLCCHDRLGIPRGAFRLCGVADRVAGRCGASESGRFGTGI
ncbi:MAG: hypothetical protein GWO24_31150, partial [Akkermansiaceae bacterium]|nr:hypothetical protein [Akkermansiaceae bacterium]